MMRRHDELIRLLLRWAMFIVAVAFLGGFPLYLVAVHGPWLWAVMSDHPAAAIDLPLAALVATCLVVLLDSRESPIEFEGLGFKFRGASGPIVLWVLSFLAITVAIRVLWHAGS